MNARTTVVDDDITTSMTILKSVFILLHGMMILDVLHRYYCAYSVQIAYKVYFVEV